MLRLKRRPRLRLMREKPAGHTAWVCRPRQNPGSSADNKYPNTFCHQLYELGKAQEQLLTSARVSGPAARDRPGASRGWGWVRTEPVRPGKASLNFNADVLMFRV